MDNDVPIWVYLLIGWFLVMVAKWAFDDLVAPYLHTIGLVLFWAMISLVGAAIASVLGYFLCWLVRQYLADRRLRRELASEAARQTREAEERHASRMAQLARAAARLDAQLAANLRRVELGLWPELGMGFGDAESANAAPKDDDARSSWGRWILREALGGDSAESDSAPPASEEDYWGS